MEDILTGVLAVYSSLSNRNLFPDARQSLETKEAEAAATRDLPAAQAAAVRDLQAAAAAFAVSDIFRGRR